ncbi:hypothetical protein TNCV_4958001 [Trichonephila clavipes]|nr:hypothetical protein TNCV_4958001 [Trichonephila clavipes]
MQLVHGTETIRDFTEGRNLDSGKYSVKNRDWKGNIQFRKGLQTWKDNPKKPRLSLYIAIQCRDDNLRWRAGVRLEAGQSQEEIVVVAGVSMM